MCGLDCDSPTVSTIWQSRIPDLMAFPLYPSKPSALKRDDMKSIIVLAFMASPAFADVYKCHSGSRTIYQDAPCPDARVMDRIDSQASSHQEQLQAMEQAAKERTLLTQLAETREAKNHTVTVTPKTAKPGPVAPRSNRPDKYYDRPDRYYGRPDKYKNRAANNARPIKSR